MLRPAVRADWGKRYFAELVYLRWQAGRDVRMCACAARPALTSGLWLPCGEALFSGMTMSTQHTKWWLPAHSMYG